VCDWYVELAKVSLSDGQAADGARRVLGEVFDVLLRLLHPLVPFVTEALWIELTGGESLAIAGWPRSDLSAHDATATAAIAQVQVVVTEVRRFRADQGVKPAQRVPAQIDGLRGPSERSVRALLRLDAPTTDFHATAEVLAAGVRVALDLSDAVDVSAERARLQRALVNVEKERDQVTRKLSTESFLAKAPAEVVASVRDRLTAAEAEIERINVALAALPQ
jgi:valyl-tRNA synthetase